MPDTGAAQFWLDEVIERGTSGAEPITLPVLQRREPIDRALEIVFRWEGTEHIDIYVRRPGEGDDALIGWMCFRVPPDPDGLRRVHYTPKEFEKWTDLWLAQRLDVDEARAALSGGAGSLRR